MKKQQYFSRCLPAINLEIFTCVRSLLSVDVSGSNHDAVSEVRTSLLKWTLVGFFLVVYEMTEHY